MTLGETRADVPFILSGVDLEGIGVGFLPHVLVLFGINLEVGSWYVLVLANFIFTNLVVTVQEGDVVGLSNCYMNPLSKNGSVSAVANTLIRFIHTGP